MIKRFKTGLLTALLSLVALSSHADRLYVENTQMKAGGECDLNIMLEALNLSRCCAFQFDVVLPQGLETTIDNFKFYNTISGGAETEIIGKQLPNGTWRIMYYSLNNSILNLQTGAIGFIHVKGNASMEEKAHTGSIQNIVFTKLDANGSSTTMRVNANSFNVSVWREATVTARSYTRRYGEPNPKFEYDATGGQLQGTPQLSCDATATTAVGTYDIKVAPGTVKNPYVTYVPGKLTIVSASSALVFDPVNKTYGDAAFTVSPKTDVSGGAITYSSSNTSVVMVSGQTFTIVGAGTATITANQAATANYGATSTNFTVTVGQREAALSWSNLSFTYNGNSHVPTAKVTNLVGSDVCNVTVAGAQTNVGSYTATATALSNANYKLPAANTQTFTITSASSALVFDPVNKTYGDAAFTVSPKTNVSGGAITYSSSNTSVVMVSGQTFTIVGAGTATITANQAATANYGATSTNFTVTVGQREAVLSWSNLGFIYDGKSHVPTATVQNLVGNDVCNVTVTGAQTNAGSYTAIAAALSNANYMLPSANTQMFTIERAQLSIFAGNYTITQGDPMPEWKAEYRGFVNGETEAVLTRQPDFSCDADVNSAPGSYAVTVSGAEAPNYAISYQPGTLTITLAEEIVVTANSLSREYGEQNPELTWSVSGGELQGEPEIFCDVYPFSPVNTYDIVVRMGTIKNPNVRLVNGKLTVMKAALTVYAGSYTIEQGEPMPTFKAVYEGFKLDDTEHVLTTQPTITCTADTNFPPGHYPVRIYGAEARNYNITHIDGELTIIESSGIGETTMIQQQPTRWYTVDGRRLDAKPTRKGIYILNGCKVIVQ